MMRAIWGVKNQDNRPDKLYAVGVFDSIGQREWCSLNRAEGVVHVPFICYAHLA